MERLFTAGKSNGDEGLASFASQAQALWQHLDELAARPEDYQRFISKVAADAGVKWNAKGDSLEKEARREALAVSKAAEGTALEKVSPALLSQIACLGFNHASAPSDQDRMSAPLSTHSPFLPPCQGAPSQIQDSLIAAPSALEPKSVSTPRPPRPFPGGRAPAPLTQSLEASTAIPFLQDHPVFHGTSSGLEVLRPQPGIPCSGRSGDGPASALCQGAAGNRNMMPMDKSLTDEKLRNAASPTCLILPELKDCHRSGSEVKSQPHGKPSRNAMLADSGSTPPIKGVSSPHLSSESRGPVSNGRHPYAQAIPNACPIWPEIAGPKANFGADVEKPCGAALGASMGLAPSAGIGAPTVNQGHLVSAHSGTVQVGREVQMVTRAPCESVPQHGVCVLHPRGSSGESVKAGLQSSRSEKPAGCVRQTRGLARGFFPPPQRPVLIEELGSTRVEDRKRDKLP
eukprot:jgi/Botrbrau1/4810/Bobra.0325s0030.1